MEKLLALIFVALCTISIEAQTDDPITFADSKVKEICVANWDTNSDGELSTAEAAAVSDLGEVFESNPNINSFNELQYFTGLKSIGDDAFYGCTGLTSINIPNSVVAIGRDAFACKNLSNIIVDVDNKVFDSRDNCNAIIETATNKLIVGSVNTVIPNSVTSIGERAFIYRNLENIVIPESVTSIGDVAFYGCTFQNITIPKSVTSIEGSAFADCNKLQTMNVDGDNHVYDSRNNCN